jgi:hypothetical protein
VSRRKFRGARTRHRCVHDRENDSLKEKNIPCLFPSPAIPNESPMSKSHGSPARIPTAQASTFSAIEDGCLPSLFFYIDIGFMFSIAWWHTQSHYARAYREVARCSSPLWRTQCDCIPATFYPVFLSQVNLSLHYIPCKSVCEENIKMFSLCS